MTQFTKAFKYEISPTEEQRCLLNRTFGSCRFVYNTILYDIQKQYEDCIENGTKPESVNFKTVNDRLTVLKSQHDWLYEVSAVSLQQVTRHLVSAYSRFFNKKSDYPKFKKKVNHQTIHLVGNAFRLKDDGFYMAKIDTPIKVYWDRRKLTSMPTSCTISKTPTGRYYVSFVCTFTPEPKTGNGELGIDVGLTDFCVDSNGGRVPNPRFLKRSLRRLKLAQRRHAKKEKGSQNREKARLKVAKLHECVSNQRSDFLHKLTSRLINENQVISVETLRIKNMIRNRRLARSIADVSWGEFFRQLEYKTKWSRHNTLVMCHPFFPSTHLCSNCDVKLDVKLTLATRKWTCPNCNTSHDRDINAATNILNLAKQVPLNKQEHRGGVVALTA